jgi:hypothetical protein
MNEEKKTRSSINRQRDREQSDVDCNAQQIDCYCNTYHYLIHKGLGAGAKYDLSTESHLHGWQSKLSARYYYNINTNNNSYKV